MDSNADHFAAIEAGGTKFRVAVARGRDVIADTTIPTTSPDETIGAAIDFIRGVGPVRSVGIASFGPLDLDPSSSSYGSITATPKPYWSGTPLLSRVRDALGVPTKIDIDVGGAALGEWRWGAAVGLSSFVYLTVGTGIGGGVLIDDRVHHGLGHPEMGHIALERIEGDDYAGGCPFHGACLEGMAAGPEIESRWGLPAGELADRPEVWELEAIYLAQALRTYTYTLAPQRIVIGGGVMQQPGLLELVREKVTEQLGGYVTSETLLGDLSEYVVAPVFGQDAGLMGAIALAMDARSEGPR